jgi:hypothetical protein
MGYSMSLNLIHQPEMDGVDGLLNNLSPAGGRDHLGVPEVSQPDRRIPRAQTSRFRCCSWGMSGQSSLPSIAIDNRAIGRLNRAPARWRGQRIGIITGRSAGERERQRGWRERWRRRTPGRCDPRRRGRLDRQERRGRPRSLLRPPTSMPSLRPTIRWRWGPARRPPAGPSDPRRPVWSASTTSPKVSHYWPPLTTVPAAARRVRLRSDDRRPDQAGHRTQRRLASTIGTGCLRRN